MSNNNILVIHTTETCNKRCRYCSVNTFSKSFNKSMLYKLDSYINDDNIDEIHIFGRRAWYAY